MTVLKARAAAMRRQRKRIRTRARILAATAEEMERVGYENLTVDHIVEAAEIARGTFYLHYTHRSDAAVAVIRMYSIMLRRGRPRNGRSLPAEAAIRRVNAYYVATYAANSDLLAGREALMKDRPELARFRDSMNARWAQAIARDVRNRNDGATQNTSDVTMILRVRAVIAMADELLREIYVYRVPSLARYRERQEEVVDVISDIWHRALYR